MTIELKPEQERILQEALRQGRFHSVEEALDRAIQCIAPHGDTSDEGNPPAKQSLSQFLMESPLAGSGLNLERDKDPGRMIEL
jgi:hypothetical protein